MQEPQLGSRIEELLKANQLQLASLLLPDTEASSKSSEPQNLTLKASLFETVGGHFLESLEAMDLPRLTFDSYGLEIAKGKAPCQDAFFLSPKALGLADGVGGWQRFGVDPSLFAH